MSQYLEQVMLRSMNSLCFIDTPRHTDTRIFQTFVSKYPDRTWFFSLTAESSIAAPVISPEKCFVRRVLLILGVGFYILSHLVVIPYSLG